MKLMATTSTTPCPNKGERDALPLVDDVVPVELVLPDPLGHSACQLTLLELWLVQEVVYNPEVSSMQLALLQVESAPHQNHLAVPPLQVA